MLSIAERAWLGEQAKIRCDTAEALAQAGEAGRARKVCELALDTAEAIKNWNETSAGGGFSYVTPLGRVAAVLARAGDSQKALSITSKILAVENGSYETPTDKWETLCGIADGFTQAGDSKQARKICQQALKLAEKLKKMPEFKGAIDRNTELLNIYHSAEYAGEQAWILGRIAESLAKAGDAKQAKAVCEQALISANQIKFEADQINIRMECAHSKANALSSIALGLAQAGDTKLALDVCQQALQVAKMIERPRGEDATSLVFRRHSLGRIVQAMVKAGDAKGAKEVSQQTLTLAKRMGSAIASRHRGSAEMMEKRGDAKRAQQFRQAAENAEKQVDDESISALCAAAEVLANAGEIEQAREVCQQAFKSFSGAAAPYFNVSALLNVADAMMQLGQTKQGLEVYKTALAPISQLERAHDKAMFFGRIGKALAIQDGKMKKAFDADDKPMVEAILAALPAR